jgi:hypothetical protein
MKRRNIQPALPGLGIFGVKSALLCYQDYFFSKSNRFFAKVLGCLVGRSAKREFCRFDLPGKITDGMFCPIQV